MTEEIIFATALEKSDPAERAAYLDQTCAGDAALRQQVETLLQVPRGGRQFPGCPRCRAGRRGVPPGGRGNRGHRLIAADVWTRAEGSAVEDVDATLAHASRPSARLSGAVAEAGLAGPAGPLRGAGSGRPRRHGRRPQGVRREAAPRRRHQGAGAAAGRQRHGPQALRPRGPGRRRGRHEHVVAIHAVEERRTGPLPGDAVRRRHLAGGAHRAGRAAGAEGDPAHRHADRRRAGGGPRPGTGPPRRQAGQHPAGKRRAAGQDHRLRPGPGRRRRQPDAERRHRRHAAVHVAGAGPRRGGGPPHRPVQPGQRAVRAVHRPAAVPGREHDGRAQARLRGHAAADPRDQPRRAGLAGGHRRRSCRPRSRRSASSRPRRLPSGSGNTWRTCSSRFSSRSRRRLLSRSLLSRGGDVSSFCWFPGWRSQRWPFWGC